MDLPGAETSLTSVLLFLGGGGWGREWGKGRGVGEGWAGVCVVGGGWEDAALQRQSPQQCYYR